MSDFECKFEEQDDPISTVNASSPKEAAITFAEANVDRSFGDWTYVSVRPKVKGSRKVGWTRIKVKINHGPTCS